MLTLKWTAIPILTAAMALTGDTSEADAQWGISIGGSGFRVGVSNPYQSSYSAYRYVPPVRSYHSYPSHRYNSYRVHHYGHGVSHGYYRGTGHYVYRPTTVVPHGNRYGVIPGHYDYYRSRHWHH